MRKTAILWDLDGTLLNTLEDLKDATNYVLRSYGLPERSLEEVRQFVGNGAGKLMARSLPGTAGDPTVEEALERFRTYYDAHCRIKTAPYPGILAVLKQLKEQGTPMAVVSNKPDSAVGILCRDYFQNLICVTSGEISGCPRKPAPDMVFRAAEKLGVEPENCIYVGDSEVDVQTAKNAGMVCLSVLWGFRDEGELRESGAAHFCRRVEELPETLRELEVLVHGQ